MGEPGLGRGGEIVRPAAPFELQAAGVEGVLRQDEPGALVRGESPFHKGEIKVGVAAVEFVAHQGMAEVLQVEAELMFAAGVRMQTQKRKGKRESGGRRGQNGDLRAET